MNTASDPSGIRKVFATTARSPTRPLRSLLINSHALVTGRDYKPIHDEIAACRGDVAQAAALVTESLKELPGRTEYQDFALKVGAKLPPRAREMVAERARILR